MRVSRSETVRSQITVPEEFRLSLGERAREREIYEEGRRSRQIQLEREDEELRRQQEEQAEKEYKEARKRTVPKAHEVPEWYKDMPRRKVDSVERIGP
jgi:hypothetical protein